MDHWAEQSLSNNMIWSKDGPEEDDEEEEDEEAKDEEAEKPKLNGAERALIGEGTESKNSSDVLLEEGASERGVSIDVTALSPPPPPPPADPTGVNVEVDDDGSAVLVFKVLEAEEGTILGVVHKQASVHMRHKSPSLSSN